MSNDVIQIPYETMSVRAEWLRQRMAESSRAGTVYVACAALVLIVCFAAMVAAFAQAVFLILGGQAATASTYFWNAQANLIILQVALATIGVVAVPAVIFVALQPTHLLLTDSGLQFIAKGTPLHFVRSSILWEDIDRIECVQAAAHGGDVLIVHGKDNRRMSIRIANLSQDDRLKLLDAIKSRAPIAVQEPAVVRTLTTTRDHTYTELWLEAFAAPPRHDSMIPVQPGAVLKEGKYKVEAQLGAGGLGTAYLATADGVERIVLKELILPVFVDAAVRRQALKAFENEAKLLKELDHPNIVKLLDYFVHDQRAYMVLEYINGLSLKALVQEKFPSGLPEQEAIAHALQVCEALEHLHSQSPPVVHRDVTPDNLILNNKGRIKLIDFNVAQQAVSGATAIFVGKPGYLPPEQFRGEPNERSDIFALGATMHYLLTGLEPVALTVSHPKSMQAGITPAMDELVAKATALNASERYTSAFALKKALRDLAQP